MTGISSTSALSVQYAVFYICSAYVRVRRLKFSAAAFFFCGRPEIDNSLDRRRPAVGLTPVCTLPHLDGRGLEDDQRPPNNKMQHAAKSSPREAAMVGARGVVEIDGSLGHLTLFA